MRKECWGAVSLVIILVVAMGCGTASKEEGREKTDFFTSGNPQADQRAKAIQDASQTAKQKQPDTPKEKSPKDKNSAKQNEFDPEKPQTLYERLGGKPGISAIVDDFIKRAMEDPRVNWTREGVVQKSWFRRDKSVEWNATPESVAQMKDYFVQFISLASGGPVQYKGDPIKSTHANMQITKPEFDAAMGDLKATLDKLNIDSETQKELMSIFESTRPEIVPKSDSVF